MLGMRETPRSEACGSLQSADQGCTSEANTAWGTRPTIYPVSPPMSIDVFPIIFKYASVMTFRESLVDLASWLLM